MDGFIDTADTAILYNRESLTHIHQQYSYSKHLPLIVVWCCSHWQCDSCG